MVPSWHTFAVARNTPHRRSVALPQTSEHKLAGARGRTLTLLTPFLVSRYHAMPIFFIHIAPRIVLVVAWCSRHSQIMMPDASKSNRTLKRTRARTCGGLAACSLRPLPGWPQRSTPGS